MTAITFSLQPLSSLLGLGYVFAHLRKHLGHMKLIIGRMEHERQIDPIIADCERKKPLLGRALKPFWVRLAFNSSMENNDAISRTVLPHSVHVAGHRAPNIDP